MKKEDFAEYLVEDNKFLKHFFKDICKVSGTNISYDTLCKYLYNSYTWDDYLDYYETIDITYDDDIKYLRGYVIHKTQELFNDFIDSLNDEKEI